MIRNHDAGASLWDCGEFFGIGVDGYAESGNNRLSHLYGRQIGAKPVVEIR